MEYRQLPHGTEKEKFGVLGLGAGWMGVGPGTPGQAALAQLLGLPENVKPYSVVGVGYPAEDADLEAVDRFDAGRIHHNKY